MSILVNQDSKVIVQGITGKEGLFHTRQMLKYGTKVVGGVTPGKGGQIIEEVPVYNTMEEAVNRTGADTSIIFVPAQVAADAIMEAADAGIKLIVCITEGIPTQDMIKASYYVQEKKAMLLGPNTAGVISPAQCKVGIMPDRSFTPGPVGVISRSGTLTYEVVSHLTRAGLGQSTCIGIGGDPVIGLTFIDCLGMFARDTNTLAVVLIGEIGGNEEEKAALFTSEVYVPMVAFIAGKTAPAGKRMGHAGAIISGSSGTASAKIKALQKAGIPVATTAEDVAILTRELVEKQLGNSIG